MPPAAWIAFASLAFAVLGAVASGAFMLGRVSQRVTALEKRADDDAGLMEKVVTLEVEMKHANASLTKLSRDMEWVSRQLGNIAMGRLGHSGEMGKP